MLDYAGGPSVITRALKSARGRQQGRCDYRRPESFSVRRTWPAIAGFEGGGRRPQVKDHGKLAKVEEAKETELPLASPEGRQIHRPLGFCPVRSHVRLITHRTIKYIINVCCFKPLHLWSLLQKQEESDTLNLIIMLCLYSLRWWKRRL